MIVITGAAGFIGSVMAGRLEREKYTDLVLVDDFTRTDKQRNFSGRNCTEQVDRREFIGWLRSNHRFVQVVIHLGARTDTTETDRAVFDELNLEYSKDVWRVCTKFGLPLVYASSAATYGAGELGYDDSHEVVQELRPLNPYGESKNEFDKWALAQERSPFFWAGLKFFNVYGPNEYHKGRMASVLYHAWGQARETGKIRLFRSHRPGVADGEQRRDFVYVMDAVDVIFWFIRTRKASGLFNLGTGNAETFLTLAHSVFAALGMEPDIEFIDTPQEIRESYQYYTRAETGKLRAAGYAPPFTPLMKGAADYIRNYLENDAVY